jgi:small subunit ribosomal protein S20
MLRNALPGMQKSRIMPGLSTPLHRYHARLSLRGFAATAMGASGSAQPSQRWLRARRGAILEQGSDFMANTAQARKRARQAEATRQRNASLKSALRTAVKKVKKAIATGDKAAATSTLRESQAVIDRIADKRIVHKNMASRTKSRLAQAIRALP